MNAWIKSILLASGYVFGIITALIMLVFVVSNFPESLILFGLFGIAALITGIARDIHRDME